ncbi:MAG: hypothetical protein P4M11_09675 [Candidatus Pacebacteria bacterium]|nr:hypothetical protein [Candidatus Paceibacterota bacterium]
MRSLSVLFVFICACLADRAYAADPTFNYQVNPVLFESRWHAISSGAQVNIPLAGNWQFSAAAITTFSFTVHGDMLSRKNTGAFVRNLGDSGYQVLIDTEGRSNTAFIGLRFKF